MTFSRRQPRPPAEERTAVSRRTFLVVGGGAAAGSLLVGGCSSDAEVGGVSGPASSSTTAPTTRARRFFTPLEAAQVEAATARILPGTPDDPGAREAEVVVYIDGVLAAGGWASEPVYRMGPFLSREEVEAGDPSEAEGSAPQGGGSGGSGGDDPGAGGGATESLDTTSFGVVRRPIGSYDRYGEQSLLTPPEVYRAGLRAMDAHARQTHGGPFLELSPDLQDAVLADMEAGRTPAFDQPSGQDLFGLLRQHTIEGMFSDPIYGGNRDLVGWRLIGWPGAQRAYSISELQTEAAPRPPQGIDGLPHGHGNSSDRPEAELPLAGSEHAGHGGHGR